MIKGRQKNKTFIEKARMDLQGTNSVPVMAPKTGSRNSIVTNDRARDLECQGRENRSLKFEVWGSGFEV